MPYVIYVFYVMGSFQAHWCVFIFLLSSLYSAWQSSALMHSKTHTDKHILFHQQSWENNHWKQQKKNHKKQSNSHVWSDALSKHC